MNILFYRLLACMIIISNCINQDQQFSNLMQRVRNKRIAFLTNPTGVTDQLKLISDLVIENQNRYNATVICFFAPQHGLRGDRQAGDGDEDYIDTETGLPVYSLYGIRTAPLQSQLKNIDVFVYNIQDVGARYYTYIWTLTYCIEVLSKLNIPLVIYDRPNPLGRKAQGCVLSIDAGMIGRLFPGQKFSIPVRYGLTVGQLITYLLPYLPPIQVDVIKMIGYNPQSFENIQSNQWVISSPNMPTLDTVLVYPGTGIFQGTTISEGRGTTRPFQISGIADVSAQSIMYYFKNITLPGVILRPTYFIPTFSKFTNKICGGVQIHVTDKQKFSPVLTAFHLLKAYLSASPNQNISSGIDKMVGYVGFSSTIKYIQASDIIQHCRENLTEYQEIRRNAYLYSSGIAQQ